jgi:hypothetical protein
MVLDADGLTVPRVECLKVLAKSNSTVLDVEGLTIPLEDSSTVLAKKS